MDFANKTVLLVEDDANDEELFRLSLSHANINCRIDTVPDGESLLAHLFGGGARITHAASKGPDLILLDLKLPKLSGLQVLQVLKNAGHGVEQTEWPIVVFSSSDDDKDVALSYGLGALSYVCKPVAHGRYVETVQATVLYWLGISEPVPRRKRQPAAATIEEVSATNERGELRESAAPRS